MVRVVAQFFFQEGKADEALVLIKELVAETKKEAGCISYDAFTDMGDKNHVFIIECWESQEVLDIHSNSKHFTTLVPQIAAFSAKPPVIEKIELVV